MGRQGELPLSADNCGTVSVSVNQVHARNQVFTKWSKLCAVVCGVVQVRKALPKKKTRGNTGEVIKVRTPAKLVMEAPPRLQSWRNQTPLFFKA